MKLVMESRIATPSKSGLVGRMESKERKKERKDACVRVSKWPFQQSKLSV